MKLPTRAHQQVLLVLARARLGDAANGVPDAEVGWLYIDDLQRELMMDRTRVNLELHRARKLLERQGVGHPDQLVERRADTQQLRLGVRAVEVVEG